MRLKQAKTVIGREVPADPRRGRGADRRLWDLGDCVVQMDLVDGPDKHISSPRGLLDPAFELYRVTPGEPPTSAEGRLLWEMARAVDRYVGRLFEAGVLCPFDGESRDQPAERSDDSPP